VTTHELLPPRAAADGTHRRVLECALVLFGDRGFHGVSVREIAQDAGLRASSIYAHVASKEAILAELMLVGHEEHRDRLRRALLESSAEPADQIAALTRAHVEMHATYPLLARVCNREMAALTPENRRNVLAVRLDAERIIHDVIVRGIELGDFKLPEPWLAVAAIGAMGLRVAEWWDQERGFTVEQVTTRYAEFAVKLLT
jgi:AcrR family transcriptional regulator